MEAAWGATPSSPSASFSTPSPTNAPRSVRPSKGKKADGSTSVSNGNGSSSHTKGNGKVGPKKTALLFPGTGSQYVGMCSFLLDNYQTARDVWREAEESLADFEAWRKDLRLHELPELAHLDLLNWKTWQTERSEKELQRVVMNGPQSELTRSSNAQPAITVTSAALLRVLEKDYGVALSSNASFFAGHSSGEYSACVADGIITFQEGVKLTRLHGLLTSRTLQLSSLRSYTEQDARDEERAQMTALLMHPDSTVEDIQRVLDEVADKFQGDQKNLGLVEIASYNSSLQLVLSGSRAGVLYACDRLREKNIASRAADLPVFAPFHCSFMYPAAPGMTHAWKHGVRAQDPRAPIVSNLDAGLITSKEKLMTDIVASIHKPVLWAPGMTRMLDADVERFVFIGPGRALANLAKKESRHPASAPRWKGKEILSVTTEDDLRTVREACSDLVGLGNNGASVEQQQAVDHASA